MKKVFFLITMVIMVMASCQSNHKKVSSNPSAKTGQEAIKSQQKVQQIDVHDTMPQYNNQKHEETLTDYDYTAPYICPNHCPGSGSDKPGKCPVCGMELIPNPDYQKDSTH